MKARKMKATRACIPSASAEDRRKTKVILVGGPLNGAWVWLSHNHGNFSTLPIACKGQRGRYINNVWQAEA